MKPLLDLPAEPGLNPMVGLLHGEIQDAYRRLKRLVGDMSPAELEHKGPGADLNSTAQLLRHLAYIDLGYVFMTWGEEVPADLEAAYGPYEDEAGKMPAVSGVPLDELLGRYDRVQGMVLEACRGWRDADLEHQVRFWDGRPVTRRWILWHMAEHSFWHQGQIRWLKKWARQQAAPEAGR